MAKHLAYSICSCAKISSNRILSRVFCAGAHAFARRICEWFLTMFNSIAASFCLQISFCNKPDFIQPAPSFSRRLCAPVFPPFAPLRKGRGTARQRAQPVRLSQPYCDRVAPLGAPSGVLQRAALQPRTHRAPRCQRAPRGRVLVPAGGARRRPGAWPARHARGRRPDPHEPAQPVRGPSGDRARN